MKKNIMPLVLRKFCPLHLLFLERLEVQGQTLFEVWLTLSEYKCQVKYGENLRSWQINIKEYLSSDSKVFLPFRIIF